MMTPTKCTLQTNALDREAVRREVFYQARDLHFPNAGRMTARPGGSSAPAATSRGQVATDAEGEWQANSQLRAEFGYDKEAFLCYRKAEAAGLVRIHFRAQANSSSPLTTQQAEGEWQANSQLRADFGNDKEAYLAYRRAEEQGLVRIHCRQAQPNSSKLLDPQQAEGEWQANSQLRAGFGDDKEAYLAYLEAERQGLVRICGAHHAA